jgi:DeoR family transcriptional regulator of aga operon
MRATYFLGVDLGGSKTALTMPDIAADVPRLNSIVRDLIGHDRSPCDNDRVGGWAGVLAGRDKINVVAGTGSIAYGERCGRAHRVGGWSELFADEGSAYWVAVQGLNAFGRMSDARRAAQAARARGMLTLKVGLAGPRRSGEKGGAAVRPAGTDTAPPSVGRKRVERMRRLLALLADRAQDAALTLDELVAELGVSKATLRRDLAVLEDERLVARTHGGARAGDGGALEIPARLRAAQASLSKQAIARATARLIPNTEPQTLAVCGGTTTTEVIRALRRRTGLTVITNALPLAVESAAWSTIKVIITGGLVRAHSLEAVGPLSEGVFNSFTVATAVLGADGVSAECGVTTYDETEARTNRTMIAHAHRVIVVADGTKIGKVTRASLAGLAEVHDLVTDEHADPAELERIRRGGVRVHVA